MSSSRYDSLSHRIGALLQAERERQGRSKAEISRLTGLSENTIAYVEDGQSTSTYTLSVYADALRLDLVDVSYVPTGRRSA